MNTEQPYPENPVSDRSLDQLEFDLVSRAAYMNAQEYLFLCDVREFDIRQGWVAHHMNNCAEWVSWQCQLSLGAARERVRVAHELFGLPRIANAFREGRVSYSKARTLTRIAGPDNEQALLDYALERTTQEVEQHCKALRNARPELSTDDANRVFRARYLSSSSHDDGTMTLHAELPEEMGTLVMKAIEIAMSADDTADHDVTADPEAWSARRVDALVQLARSYLAGDADKAVGRGDNYSVMVHVDEAALAGRDGESGLPIETVRRITCDASLVTVVKDKQGSPLNAGRKQQVVPPAIRRAVIARDKTCRFPGCSHSNPHFLQPHHIIHWADGGETDVGNLVALCSRHHRLHHEGGYTVHKVEDGGFVFRNADGRVIPNAPPCRPAYKGDIDDKTYRELLEQHIARHVSREMYEGNSLEVQEVSENCSYISRGGSTDVECGDHESRVREPVPVFAMA